ncbi:hypothetical protein CTAYLR_010408 [Chrysophaeum taylorii]|uniref:RWD domain-containing protein n=1 Tax=Chrysophaeum taylorii TaxID=2483200 RepID=A0AAD7UI38_9STRA|nr:hypothetical protein CTAYLR_010408 [Chrysophaeum taylorii]
MADDGDEREMELEALGAIFFEELEVCEDCFKLRLAPEDAGTAHVRATLVVRCDEYYPSRSRPRFEIQESEGLAKPHLEELLALAASTAAESEGAVCGFEVASAVRAWLGDHNVPGLADDSMYANMLRRETETQQARVAEEAKADEDEEEVRRQERLRDGTPCTPETFPLPARRGQGRGR